MTLTIPTLETERLTLRAPRMDDTPLITAFLQSERARFVGGGAHRTAMDCARSLANMAGQWVLRGYGPHIFTLKDGTPIGHGGAWYPFTWPEPEFGWCLWSADHEAKGYVAEAMTRLRDWTFANTGLKTLVSYVDPDNHASQRVAQRLGGVVDPDATPPDDDPIIIYRHNAPGAA